MVQFQSDEEPAMSILTPPRSPLKTPSPGGPRRKRFTVSEFHQLWNNGWFADVKPILLDGEIIEMPIPNPPHAVAIGLTEKVLNSIFGAGYWVRVQHPLVMGLWTDPVPDLSVVTGSPRDYLNAHPSTALLVVEVADSSLSIDTDDKMQLYAAGGIPDYWVLDLNNRQLIVHRDPVTDATQRHGFRYTTVQALDATAAANPMSVPQATVRVADLLP
jgi:Uma2 family endonuclease